MARPAKVLSTTDEVKTELRRRATRSIQGSAPREFPAATVLVLAAFVFTGQPAPPRATISSTVHAASLRRRDNFRSRLLPLHFMSTFRTRPDATNSHTFLGGWSAGFKWSSDRAEDCRFSFLAVLVPSDPLLASSQCPARSARKITLPIFSSAATFHRNLTADNMSASPPALNRSSIDFIYMDFVAWRRVDTPYSPEHGPTFGVMIRPGAPKYASPRSIGTAYEVLEHTPTPFETRRQVCLACAMVDCSCSPP